ncbi:cell wall metabolism sensor histidine kinase WalK, partial [Escherichia coli]|nr:cell wall metabolism sensor histidine kinase WalK [Escherichia coli]
MDRNARALLALVNTLINYSQLEAGRASLRLEELDAARFIASLAEGFAEEARRKGLEFVVEIAHDLGPVIADRDKLAQVVFNLLSN